LTTFKACPPNGGVEPFKVVEQCTMEESGDDKTKSSISRRNFLKLTGLTLGGLSLASRPYLERLKPDSSVNLAVIDLFKLEELKKDPAKREIFGGIDIDKGLDEMGIENYKSEKDILLANPQTDVQTKALLLQSLFNTFRNHGENVSFVGEKVSKFFEKNDEQNNQKAKLQLMDSISFAFDKDTNGNTRLNFNVSADTLIKMVAGQDAEVINMSFEVGKNYFIVL
jgi:hypothetical protein